MIGHFRNNLKRPQSLDILTDKEKEQYKQTIIDTMAYISPDLIATTELPGLYEDLRVGILNLYFRKTRNKINAYITHYDNQKNLIRISILAASDTINPDVYNDGFICHKSFLKIIRKIFINEAFFYEIAFWIPVDSGIYTIKLQDHRVIRFRINGKSFDNGISTQEILVQLGKKLSSGIIKSRFATQFDNAWLLMDRTDKGDDNAEHFYRYLMNIKSSEKYYFILNRNSPDWNRLKSEGFKLIPFQSWWHLVALRRAKYLISSHADIYIRKPFSNIQLRDATYKFLFIQHGVTKDNQSEWFNNIMPSLLATATVAEYNSIVDTYSDYYLSCKEVALTGFPRHDTLLKFDQTLKTIFIMPTWRENLSGKIIHPGVRTLKPGFENSEYAMRWMGLLTSEHLHDLAVNYKLRIIFCPHPNWAKYLDILKYPSYVEAVRIDCIQSLQPLFAEMAVMITDYSSVAFDAAILNKPVVYYQFDRDAFFSGHIYRAGYFNYINNGFGPVVEHLEDVIDAVTKAISGKEIKEYSDRRLTTFPFRDGKSSSRLFSAIQSLG
jgi:CDP-glycerol glycerophosphotransferase (TagB/SpsB family)